MKLFSRWLRCKLYLEWRGRGRPVDVGCRTYGYVDKHGRIVITRRIFDAGAAIRAHRRRSATGRFDPAWVETSRKWQIKAKLNYGRY